MNGDMLYKYRVLCEKDGSFNEFTKKLIFNGQIYLSDFESLNDPFEGRIVPIYKNITKEKVLELHPILKDMEDFDSIDWKDRGVILQILERFKPRIEENLKKYGVFCTSSKYDSDLMWAHYADSHKGICVGFNAKELKKITRYEILPVHWSEKRPEVDFSGDGSHYKDYIVKMLTTKSHDWMYEQEHRMIAFCPEDRKLCCFGAIQEIYLGCRIENNKNFNKEDFIRNVKKVHPHCEIKEMKMNIDTLKIESCPILSK